jgi:predicted protein tyrosine phosphatase
MKKISITGHKPHAINKLKDVLDGNPKEFDAIIITTESLPSYVPDLTKSYLHLKFDDVIFDYGTHQKPEKHHVKEALEWGKGKENIVVACHAGVSRSSAIAYSLVCQEYGPVEALKIFNPFHHSPNKRIVYLASKILKDESVWDHFVEWSTKNLNDPCESFKKWFDSQEK